MTNQINTQVTFLQNESVNLKSEEDSLVGIHLTTADAGADCNQGYNGATSQFSVVSCAASRG